MGATMLRCGLILFSAAMSQGALAADPAAVRFVQAARFDYTTKLATTLALEGKIPKESLDCVAAIPLSTYTTNIASFVESRLGAEDLAAATSFYESSVGKKYTQYGIAQFHTLKGIPSDVESPVITDGDMQKIVAFSRTSAGSRLMNREFPRDMVLATKAWEDEALGACGVADAP